MNNENLKRRTRKFALDILHLVEALPPDRASRVLGTQLLRSGTSVGANYRAACRAKSPADFIAKMGIVEEEADESAYWLELLVEAGKLTPEKVGSLLNEANQITAISVASINTARKGAADKRSTLKSTPHSAPTANQSSLPPTPHSALRTPHSALPSPPSLPPQGKPALSPPKPPPAHSALRTPHSALQ